MAEVGREIVEHQLSEEQMEIELRDRMKKLIERRPHRVGYEGQIGIEEMIPLFTVTSYRFRRIGNFSDLLVQGRREDDDENHARIWVRSTKRNKTDKPNIIRAAEICLNRVAEDILLNKPLN